MSATVWLFFSIAAFALAGVFLALTVILFFHFKIPDVLSDLSGRRAAREVAALRGDSEEAMRNAQSSGRTSDFSAMASAHESKRLDLSDAKTEPMDTTGGHAEVLNHAEEPVELEYPLGITQVLNENRGTTQVLAENEVETRHTEDLKRIEHFTIIRTITEIHTEEYV